MAISSDVCWEIQVLGSDSNGGGFKAGASGTDRSQSTSAHATLTTSSVVHSTTTQINVHASNHTVSAADVGNVLQVTGGTATAGFYEITVADVPNNRWTVDRAVGTAGQTVAGAMGGCLASLHKIGTANNTTQLIQGQKIFIKAGTYQRSATTTVNAPAASFADTSRRAVRVIGYNTTRGDTPRGNNRPVIQLITNTGQTCVDFSGTANGSGWMENVILDGNGLGTSSGLTISNASIWNTFINVTVKNCTSVGIYVRGESLLMDCEATNITGGLAGIRMSGDFAAIRCWSHDNTVSGFYLANKSGLVWQCVSSNNTGATSHGYEMAYGYQFIHNVAYANGGDGIRTSASGVVAYINIQNNILVNNGAYGISFGANNYPRLPFISNNAFYNNTSGSFRDFANTSGSNGVGALTDPNITLTGDPFTDAANDDFTLNNTSGAGAACRATGFTGTAAVGTITSVGYQDVGVFQHQDSGGGGSAGGAHIFGGTVIR